MSTAAVLIPGDPPLQGVFKAQCARTAVGEDGGLGHHQPDEVIGKEVNPDFLLRHLGCLAAQPLHAERGLDVAEVELDVPALAVKRLQVRLGKQIKGSKPFNAFGCLK